MVKLKTKPKAILLVGRDNWQKDNDLNVVLLNYLKQTGITIIWEDPAATIFHKVLRFQNGVKWLPERLRLFNTRLLQIALCIFKPGYYSYMKPRLNQSINGRMASLEKRINTYKHQFELCILSRSSGAIVASKLADKLGIGQLICISYPFEHPDNGIEPYRFKHLENLATPFLIFQGRYDEYGGAEVVEKYNMSSSIQLCFVDTNHNFDLDAENWEHVLFKIAQTISSRRLIETEALI
jgi:hypothetical protein